MLFSFERLRVWQEARAFVKDVYAATKLLPKEEVFGLTSQLTRAAVSIACNLAEGSGRTSAKDQAHFSQLAYGSLMETACLIALCEDLGFWAPQVSHGLREQIDRLAVGINALRKSQLRTNPNVEALKR